MSYLYLESTLDGVRCSWSYRCWCVLHVVWIASEHLMVLVLKEHRINIWIMNQRLLVLHLVPTVDDRKISENGKRTWQDQRNQK